MARKLLIIQAAAWAADIDLGVLPQRFAQSVFPAVTCTVQASFRTASPPSAHGMIANGLFSRDLGRAMFWEQSARLVAGPRIWDDFRRRGRKVGMLFWQQSMGESADVLLTPAPIHKHHGGMIEYCHSRPAGLYAELCRTLGRPFRLRRYWGPLASHKAGDWIAEATAALLARAEAPDLCLTYLPTLDYDFQRHEPVPDSPKTRRAREALAAQLALLLEAARRHSYDMLIFGDYAMRPVERAVFPNRALLAAGLMDVRQVGGMLYPDLHAGRAFAVVDHEVAHVYVRDAADVERVRQLFLELEGVAEVLTKQDQQALSLDHQNSGELVIVAEAGSWLAYPWWRGRREAPDYAGHVDIHNKPGYDPCELFFGFPPPSVSRNTARIRGSHGRAGAERQVAWAATFEPPGQPKNLIELAAATREWLNEA